MEALLIFFEAMPTWQKLVWVVGCLSASWALEGLRPLVDLPYRKWRHAGVNGTFLGTSLVINVLFGGATLAVASWTANAGFGIVHWFSMPLWAQLVGTLLILDFVAQYVAHVILHQWRWLWRFHVVHHSDTKVDATTGARLHPGDYTFRELLALAGMALAGAPLGFYVIYRVLTIFFTFWAHANVSLPPRLDAALSWVFVTPDLHKFHHHAERPWTDMNYGGILSVWDRMFGTLVYGDPRHVVYGLDVTDGARDEDVLHQFGLPFSGGSALYRGDSKPPRE